MKYFPAGKVAVLGLVTTKSPKLESAEDIKARVNEAAEVMSKDNPNRSKQDALNQYDFLRRFHGLTGRSSYTLSQVVY